jgi:hypothetical protein
MVPVADLDDHRRDAPDVIGVIAPGDAERVPQSERQRFVSDA